MQKLINQRTTRYTQMPWAVYPELLQAINLQIVLGARSVGIFDSFNADQLRKCNFEITFKGWDVTILQTNPQLNFDDLFLVVTIEDPSIWQSYSELIKIDKINNSSKFSVKPNIKFPAFEGLIFRFRIISKSNNEGKPKTLKSFSVLGEREIILHTENSETNFEIRIVDKLSNQRNPNIAFCVVFDENSDPFSQSIGDCVYVEVLRNASIKHTVAHDGGAGKLVNALFVSTICSEIIFGLNEFMVTDDVKVLSGVGSPNSMVEKICTLFDFQSAQQLRDCINTSPQDIFEKSRELSKLAAAYSFVRK